MRRDLLQTAAAAPLAAGPAFALSLTFPPALAFEVTRNGRRIGSHAIEFRQDGGVLTANTKVEIVVRLGPIPVYRYTHKVREIWRDGAFASLTSETNDDGTAFRVMATRAEGSVVVESSAAKRAVMAAETVPLTHWNYLCMERPLFNPQDGLPIASRVQPRGEETVSLADGRTVRAARYSLTGKVALDDWYDPERIWTALRSMGKDGSTIDYRRTT